MDEVGYGIYRHKTQGHKTQAYKQISNLKFQLPKYLSFDYCNLRFFWLLYLVFLCLIFCFDYSVWFIFAGFLLISELTNFTKRGKVSCIFDFSPISG